MRLTAVVLTICFSLFLVRALHSDDRTGLAYVDHYVAVQSTVPSITGQTTEIYVRERIPGAQARVDTAADRVVLFVHGAGTPAEVSFDVPYQDYSWMAFLANAGFDVFAMDMTGYGRSTRPLPMNDPCNLAPEQQGSFVPSLLAAPCPPDYPRQMTTIASDWNDISAVVDYIRALRHVDRVNLVAWSLGGPRAGGFAAQHPDKIQKLVFLAPAYSRSASANAPEEVPAAGAAMNTQSHAEFVANWDRQVGCPAQYDPTTSESVWSEMLKSDPVGATWGTGVRRAPQVTNWGWTKAAVAQTQVPVLMVSGQYDKQVPQQRVRDLYEDIGSPQKVFIDLACSSHNAMWEKNHSLLFQASLEWLTQGMVNGHRQGMLKMGYSAAGSN